MCVTLGPALLSRTNIYVGEAMKDGELVHVLAYQNRVSNLAPNGQPNAMMLPFPAVPGTMTDRNVIDCTPFPHFLEEMAQPIVERYQDYSAFLGALSPEEPLVFEVGVYTVVMADHAAAMADGMGRVAPERRPTLPRGFFQQFAEWYPGCTFALCCFSNREALQAAPLLWFYQPTNPEQLFAPTLDAHDGNLPRVVSYQPFDVKRYVETQDLSQRLNLIESHHHIRVVEDTEVRLDHTVLWGASRESAIKDGLSQFIAGVNFPGFTSSLPPDVAALMPSVFDGRMYNDDIPLTNPGQRLPNGDLVLAAEDARRGYSERVHRVPPPGAR